MKTSEDSLRVKIIRERLDEIIRESKVASGPLATKLKKSILQYEKIIQELKNESL